MFMQRVSVYPNPQDITELRTLLIERVVARQAQGMRVALSELIAGSKTPQFTISTLFEDLTAFEAVRKGYQSDAASEKLTAKIASLIREPLAVDLLEVLVPMPG